MATPRHLKCDCRGACTKEGLKKALFKVGDIIKTTGILSNDLEIYRIKRRSANGGYWCESLTHREDEELGKREGTIDGKGILLFEEAMTKVVI